MTRLDPIDHPPRPSEQDPAGSVDTGRRRDLVAAAGAALLVLLAYAVGRAIQEEYLGGKLYVKIPPPLYAEWLPHIGPGTPAAVAVALAVALHGPALSARLPWRRLLLASWGAALAWTWSLALVDGWHRGVAERLTTENEYLRVIDRFSDIGAALRTYTRYILMDQPDNWPAHVAGHPPAAVLTFVGLDRIGLGGGAWAGAWCITVGATAVIAILVTLRALGEERVARRAAPFLVLAPAAVWVGASADGYFAAVAAWGLALLALSARARRASAAVALACAAGVLLGLTVYLSYGLTLMAVPAVVILLFARTARPLPFALAGAVAVAAAFTLAGFWWWEGYDLLVVRYYQGVAAERPYTYWVWANLANAVLTIGLASAAGLRRVAAGAPAALRRWRARAPAGADALVALVLAMLAALALADLSGMSKAETERIWLPFVVWLPAAAALLPSRDHRWWLLGQGALALAVNHLLLTGW